jgi:hypothetical protein
MALEKLVGEETSRSSQGNALFPWKLHKMLTFCETEGKDTVVSWLPQGKAFKVHNTAAFVSEILPMHFKQTKYKSFQRQLNLWGFQRITKGTETEKGAYFHPDFLKNQEDLCQKLNRQSAKKQSSEAVKSTKSAPKTCAAHVSDDESTSSLPKTRPLVPSPSSSGAVPRLVSDSAKDTSFTDIQPVLFEGCPFFLLDMPQEKDLDMPQEEDAIPIIQYSQPSKTSADASSAAPSFGLAAPSMKIEKIDMSSLVFSSEQHSGHPQLCAV